TRSSDAVLRRRREPFTIKPRAPSRSVTDKFPTTGLNEGDGCPVASSSNVTTVGAGPAGGVSPGKASAGPRSSIAMTSFITTSITPPTRATDRLPLLARLRRFQPACELFRGPLVHVVGQVVEEHDAGLLVRHVRVDRTNTRSVLRPLFRPRGAAPRGHGRTSLTSPPHFTNLGRYRYRAIHESRSRLASACI